jgi:predicted RNA binding protein YcfA (HicA-like mRNA interferase family)
MVSQKGSHIKFIYNKKHLTIPNHNEISIGTLNTIFKEVGKITEKYKEVNELFLN